MYNILLHSAEQVIVSTHLLTITLTSFSIVLCAILVGTYSAECGAGKLINCRFFLQVSCVFLCPFQFLKWILNSMKLNLVYLLLVSCMTSQFHCSLRMKRAKRHTVSSIVQASGWWPRTKKPEVQRSQSKVL